SKPSLARIIFCSWVMRDLRPAEGRAAVQLRVRTAPRPRLRFGKPTTNDRGRDARYRAPPAQIRTCGTPAYGSHLGYLTANRWVGQGGRIFGFGSQSSANFVTRCHVEASFWLRRRRLRRHRHVTW